MNKREAWRLASEQLIKAGKIDGRFEAELLLRSALGESRARFFATLDEVIDEAALAQFRAWIEARLEGRPLQHLLGRQEFMGLQFKVTPDVLVPRPDTEIAVEVVLELIKEVQEPLVVDLATGSGAIAVAVAYHAPQAQVWATDISAAALAVAQQNAKANGVAERVTFLEGSWAEPLLAQGRRYHCVVSNPPYIPTDDIAQLAIEVQREPRLALDGGPDGLDCYRALIPQAWELLLPGGHLVLEVGQGQADAVAMLLQQQGFSDPTIHPDLAGIPRVVAAQRPRI